MIEGPDAFVHEGSSTWSADWKLRYFSIKTSGALQARGLDYVTLSLRLPIPATSLTEVVDAIRAFQTLEQIKPPERRDIKPMSAYLAHKLHEPHYWDGPDTLHLLDLTVFPESTNAVPTDSLRHHLQARVPTSLLDKDGKMARQLLKEDAEAGGSTYNIFTKPSMKDTRI